MKVNAKRLYRVYSIFLSALSIVIGLLFLLHVLYIYVTRSQSGEQIFTREIVGQHLMQMLAPMIIFAMAVIGGVVIKYVFPLKEKEKITFSEVENLKKIKENIEIVGENEKVREIKKISLYKKIFFISALCICLVSMILCLWFLLDKTKYEQETSMTLIIKIVAFCGPFILLGFASLITFVIIEEKFAKKELQLMKDLISLKMLRRKEKKHHSNKKQLWIVRGVLLVFGATFIIVGAINGDIQDILSKAIIICAECIGLG